MTRALNAEYVNKIFRDCLFKDGEDTTDRVITEGITLNVGFHPGRLNSHKDEIKSMLDELPDQFQWAGGGGWSFLNAVEDKHGFQWAEHQNVEQLLLLGLATGQAAYMSTDRDIWAMLPGGMPYFMVGIPENTLIRR